MNQDYNDELFLNAVSKGCKPVWHDGMFGWAWHCGCDDAKHAYDQQCSIITKESLNQN